MRNSFARYILIRAVTALSVLSVSATSGWSGSNATCESRPYRMVQKALQVTFPDIAPTSFLALTVVSSFDQVPSTFGEIAFRITDMSPGSEQYLGGSGDRQPGIRKPQTLLEGIFAFNRSGELEQAFIRGDSLTNKEKNEALRSTANAHHEWTDVEALQALKGAGATYGPWARDAFLKSLPIKGLGDAFKGTVALKEANFVALSATREGDFAVFQWMVVFEIKGGPGEAAQYKGSFEPFGGRLTWLGKSKLRP
jgi:hypothetical protein